jgi:hypothetical protein
MKTLKIASLVAGSISALVALIGFSISLWNMGQDSTEERIKKWQSVVVYSIIETQTQDSANSATPFEAIKAVYLDAVQQFKEYPIPIEAISDQSLQRVLIDLLSRRTIVSLPGRKYRIAYEPFMMRDPNFEIQSRLPAVSIRVVYYCRTEPNKYTPNQMADKLVPEFPGIPVEMIQMVINQGINSEQVFLDSEKKLTIVKP